MEKPPRPRSRPGYTAAPDDDLVQRAALMALYNSTDGPYWLWNYGWGSRASYCNWYGVICDGDNINALKLRDNQLRGQIPPELDKLYSLQYLDLSGNELTGPIPPELGNLRKIIVLALYWNQLGGQVPPELGNLGNLRFLYLSSNQLSGPIPPELGSLSNLSRLWLHSNQLSGPIPAELSYLLSLSDLCLNGNPALECWETETALNWTTGLDMYWGPDIVCPFFVCLPVITSVVK